MVNEIKMDKISAALTSGKTTSVAPKNASTEVKQEGVTISNRLKKWVDLMHVADSSINEDAKAAAVKQAIEEGTYQVDVNALSHKLIQEGIVKL